MVLLAMVLLAGACSRGDAKRTASPGRASAFSRPILRRLDRLTLLENDTAYVGRPAALSVDSLDGSLYVTDEFWGRVLRFSSSGHLMRGYGRRGGGPGELRSPGTVEVVGGAVVVLDANRVTRYGRDDGSYLGSARFEGTFTSIRSLGDRLWFGGLNLRQRTSLGTWAPGEPLVRAVGTVPVEFTRSEPLAGIYTGVEVAAWGDTVLAGYEGLNRLTLFRTDGTPLRSVAVPVRARRGELPHVVEAMQRLDFPAQFGANSVLFRLQRTPAKNFVLVHYDQSIDGSLITARVYVSLLSSDLSRGCVDHEVPVSRDAQPYTAFRSDTLYVVQQEVTGQRARTFVDRYRIDEQACPELARPRPAAR